MFIIHSPDNVFTILVSIFMETHNHFWAPSHCYKCVFTGIYSKWWSSLLPLLTYAHCEWYVHEWYIHVCTNVPTPPALCLGTDKTVCISWPSVTLWGWVLNPGNVPDCLIPITQSLLKGGLWSVNVPLTQTWQYITGSHCMWQTLPGFPHGVSTASDKCCMEWEGLGTRAHSLLSVASARWLSTN